MRFDGNRVTSTLAPVMASDHNGDLPPTTAPRLTGNSSYGTSYPVAVFAQQGLQSDGDPWGPYRYADGDRVRDVVLSHGSDGAYWGTPDTRQLMSFVSRSIVHQDGNNAGSDGRHAGYLLGPLTAQDEMLVIMLDGFVNGEAGVNFGADALAGRVPRPNAAKVQTTYDMFGGSFESRWGDAEPMAAIISDGGPFGGSVVTYRPGGGAMRDGFTDSYRLNSDNSWEEFLDGENGTPFGGGDGGMIAPESANPPERASDADARDFQIASISRAGEWLETYSEPTSGEDRLGSADWFRAFEASVWVPDALVQLPSLAAELHMGPGTSLDFFIA